MADISATCPLDHRGPSPASDHDRMVCSCEPSIPSLPILTTMDTLIDALPYVDKEIEQLPGTSE